MVELFQRDVSVISRHIRNESDLFGREKDESFKGSIGNIYQSFNGRDVYESLMKLCFARERSESKTRHWLH